MANLGITNKNPLNIRYVSTINWKGQTGQNYGFAKFSTMVYGYRAALKNLQSYINDNFNTIEKIVYRWAPKGDGKNNPESYTQNVSKRTGISRTKVISANDLETLEKIAGAMAVSEIGTNFPNDLREAVEMIADEQNLILPGTPPPATISNVVESEKKKSFSGLLTLIAIGGLGLLIYRALYDKNTAK